MVTRFRFTAPRPLVWPRAFARSDEEWAHIHRIADGLAPELRAAFLRVIARVNGDIPVARWAAILGSVDLAGLDAVIPWDRLDDELETVFRQTLSNGVEQAGIAAIPLLPLGAIPRELQLGLRFDLTNPFALRWIDEHVADLVRGVGDETRKGIRTIIRRAFEAGGHPYRTARQLRPLIGLTEGGALAVDNYRRFLERQVAGKNALAQTVRARLERAGYRPDQIDRLLSRGLSPARIDELVIAYAERLLDERAETIARTETLDASNSGQRLLWRSLANQGYLLPALWERRWITTPDDRICPACQAMSRKRAPIDGLYENGSGGPPRHPRCRCAESLQRVQES